MLFGFMFITFLTRASGIAFRLLSDLTISGFLPLRKYNRRFDVRLNFAVLSGSLSCFANPRLTLNPLFLRIWFSHMHITFLRWHNLDLLF